MRANAYAPAEDTSIMITVATAATRRLLRKYRLKWLAFHASTKLPK